jgi:predicted membrane chloride channel (bestrophin family)
MTTALNAEETTPLLQQSEQIERGEGEESQTLPPPTPKKNYFQFLTHLRRKKETKESIDYRHDVMMYKNTYLTNFEAFKLGPHSVWRNPDLWSMMARLGVVVILTAVLTICTVPDPAGLQIGKFSDASKFLSVVIGLLMGFFLKDAAQRWHDCVNGFLQLLDAVRNMCMQLDVLGVPLERSLIVNRFGLASAWLLYGDLLMGWKKFSVSAPKGADMELWDHLASRSVDLDGKGKIPLLLDDEVEFLKTMRDPPGMMWMWISNLVGKLSQDGYIPGMATPTYGRIMNLCQNGHGGMRSVRASVSVQAPLPYTHTLAILVHINNLINAILLGLVLGVQLGVVVASWDLKIAGVPIYRAHATNNEVVKDTQMLVITFLFLLLWPTRISGIADHGISSFATL